MQDFLQTLQIKEKNSGVYYGDWVAQPGGKELVSYNPTTGESIASVLTCTAWTASSSVKWTN